MRPARATVLTIGLFCALLAMGHTPAAAQGDAPPLAHMPGIARGDFWDFDVTGDAEGTVQNRVETIEMHDGRDGTRHRAFRVHAVSEVLATQRSGAIETQVQERLEVDKWVRTEDEGTIDIDGTVTIQHAGQNTRATDVRRQYDPPLVESVYPYGVGSAWEVRVTVYTEQGSEVQPPRKATLLVTVLDHEEVTVPAGTFMAYKMNITLSTEGGYTLRWYAPEACTTVREERYDVDKSRTGPAAVYVLTDYRCSHVETTDPKYDPSYIKLLSRPTVAPSTSDTVTFTDPPGAAEGVGPGVWVALAVVVGVSLTLIGYGRRRR